MEELFLGDFDADSIGGRIPGKIFVLIIYDIVQNRKRQKLAKLMEGYGFRVQKSAFESELEQRKYDKLLQELIPFGTDGDSIRIYRILGKTNVITLGEGKKTQIEDVMVL